MSYTYIDKEGKLIRKKTTTTTVYRDKDNKITEKVEVTVDEIYTYTQPPHQPFSPRFDANKNPVGSGSTHG